MQHARGPKIGRGLIGCAILLPLSHQLHSSSTCVWIRWELCCTYESTSLAPKVFNSQPIFDCQIFNVVPSWSSKFTCTHQHRSPRIMGSCRGFFKDECNTPQLLFVCRLQQLRLVTCGCSFTSGRLIKYALLFCTFFSLFCSCLTSALAPAPAPDPAIPPLPVPLADLPGSWNATLIDNSWYYYETKEGMGFFHTQFFADVEWRCTWSVSKSTIMLTLTYYAQQLCVFSGFRMLSNWRALTTKFNQIWQQCKFATRIFEKSLYLVGDLEHMVRIWWF
jgi:hypothetical protein